MLITVQKLDVYIFYIVIYFGFSFQYLTNAKHILCNRIDKNSSLTFKMLSLLHCKLGLLQKSSQSLGGCSQSVVVKTQIQAVRLCMYQGKPTYDTHRKGSTSPKILQVTCKIQPVISAG